MQVAPRHHQLVADPQAAAANRAAVGVQHRSQRLVERVDPELAAVDRREHLDVAYRIDPVVRRKPPADERHDLLARRDRARALDQEQVATHPLRGGEVGGGAAADRVRPLHDHAPRGLAEDVRQPRGWDSTGRDELGERLAGADRGQLIGVADEHDVCLGADRAQQRDEQLEVGHRALVDDQQIARQRILLVVRGPLAGDPAQRGVDRLGAHPARLAHPDRRPPGRSDEHHPHAATGGQPGDRTQRGGLAGARTAGDQRQPMRSRVRDAGELLGGQRNPAVGRRGLSEPVAGRALDELPDPLRELGL